MSGTTRVVRTGSGCCLTPVRISVEAIAPIALYDAGGHPLCRAVARESSCGPSPFTACAARGVSPCDCSHAEMSAAAWLPSPRTSAA